MKKAWIFGVIVGLHCLVIGSLVLMQGCGTTPKPTPPPASPPGPVVMPPPVQPPAPPPAPPAPPLTPVPVVMPPVKVEPVPAALETKTYTIKEGDSISRIAQRFNVTVRDIVKMNKIANPNKVRVGQKLTLPGYVNLNAPVPPRKHKPAPGPKEPAPVAGSETYVVKAGDYLSKIAQAHGTTTKALRAVNNLTSDKLRVGQKLVLPQVAGVAEPAPAPELEPALEPAAEGGMLEAAPPAPGKTSEMIHIVEQNQELSDIAMMYGVRTEEIMKLNGLTTPEVKVGQALKIPPPTEL